MGIEDLSKDLAAKVVKETDEVPLVIHSDVTGPIREMSFFEACITVRRAVDDFVQRRGRSDGGGGHGRLYGRDVFMIATVPRRIDFEMITTVSLLVAELSRMNGMILKQMQMHAACWLRQ